MSEKVKPIVVFDTGIILQAAINPGGPSAAVCALLEAEKITVYISSRLRSEIESVFYRPVIRAKNPQITDTAIQEGLALLDDKAIRIPNPPPLVSYARDPNDAPVINLALQVKANYIISRDKDLLDLMDENLEAGRNFRTMFPALSVLDPVAFLRQMEREE